jgi:hypothetical protein
MAREHDAGRGTAPDEASGTSPWPAHRHGGWCVGGGGQHGMEYRVLLVAGLVAMVIAGSPRRGAVG